MPTIRRTPKRPTTRTRAGKAASRAPEVTVAPRILSADEKRELILAHARARRPVDPVQRMSLWAGVFVCVLFVVGAWFFTVGSGIKRTMAGPPDESVKRTLEMSGDFADIVAEDNTERAQSLQEGFAEVEKRLDALATEQQLIQAMADQLNATSTATTTSPGLFKPDPTSPPTTTEPQS